MKTALIVGLVFIVIIWGPLLTADGRRISAKVRKRFREHYDL